MAFKATLSVDSKDYKLLSCSYAFIQHIGADGRPVSDVKGGRINLVVDSTDQTKLVEWMVDPNKTFDGEITFYYHDADKVMKKVKFTKGFCVEYSESFADNSDMLESIVISAEKITIGNAQLENRWPDS